MERPDEVSLSRQDGEALSERLQGDALTAHDRQVLEQVLRWYFWLRLALQGARFRLKRLRVMVFGEQPKKRLPPPSAPASMPQESNGGPRAWAGSHTPSDPAQATPGASRPGYGRWSPQAYGGAQRMACRHEE